MPYAEVYGNEKILKSLPSVPDNAFVVSLNPLRWVQFGRGTLLVTDGRVWLDEEMAESDFEVDGKRVYWRRTEEGWAVKLPFGEDDDVYIIKGKRLVPAADIHDENVIFEDDSKKLYVKKIDGEKQIVEEDFYYGTMEVIPEEDLYTVVLVDGYYTPLAMFKESARKFLRRMMK